MPHIRLGLTVVGKPVAAVITSEPGSIRRSRIRGEVRAAKASRLAEEPELQVRAERTPMRLASRASNWAL